MNVDTNNIFSMSQANQNFSEISRSVDANGEAVIFKNNKPRYYISDFDNAEFMLSITDDEKIDIVAKRILKKYLPAFKELAK